MGRKTIRRVLDPRVLLALAAGAGLWLLVAAVRTVLSTSPEQRSVEANPLSQVFKDRGAADQVRDAPVPGYWARLLSWTSDPPPPPPPKSPSASGERRRWTPSETAGAAADAARPEAPRRDRTLETVEALRNRGAAAGIPGTGTAPASTEEPAAVPPPPPVEFVGLEGLPQSAHSGSRPGRAPGRAFVGRAPPPGRTSFGMGSQARSEASGPSQAVEPDAPPSSALEKVPASSDPKTSLPISWTSPQSRSSGGGSSAPSGSGGPFLAPGAAARTSQKGGSSPIPPLSSLPANPCPQPEISDPTGISILMVWDVSCQPDWMMKTLCSGGSFPTWTPCAGPLANQGPDISYGGWPWPRVGGNACPDGSSLLPAANGKGTFRCGDEISSFPKGAGSQVLGSCADSCRSGAQGAPGPCSNDTCGYAYFVCCRFRP